MRGAVNSASGSGSPGRRLVGAVGNAIVHRGQVGQVEHIAHAGAALGAHAAFHMVVLGEGKVHRDRLRRWCRPPARPPWLCSSRRNCSQVVAVVQVGPRERGLEAAGPGDKAVAQAARCRRVAMRDTVSVWMRTMG